MKVLTENRRAYLNYEVLEKFQGGLVLQGQEVKSVKLGKAQITGAYVVVRGEELWLVGANIPPYQPKNAPRGYNPERSRKLLLQKKEISYLLGKAKERGLTLVPLRVYTTSAGKIKLEFALAKRKKKWDKREAIKKREVEMEMRRAMGTEEF